MLDSSRDSASAFSYTVRFRRVVVVVVVVVSFLFIKEKMARRNQDIN